MNKIKRIAAKEIYGFFASSAAFWFLAPFLLMILFIFFWVDPFFARNSADLRPIFEAMPTLLVFLCSALTMKMWSEERRTGTLEFLLASPLSNLELVMGKFLGCFSLVILAILLTLPLPISIALFAGPLDWGPTIGGYLATLFLAAAYTAIGLAMSARTDNQIVSLLLSVFVCGLFLIVGSPTLTHLFNSEVSDVLTSLGSGAHFQSIARGIIDFRDLYYYSSITCAFLTLNILWLEEIRWAGNRRKKSHQSFIFLVALCVANFIAANLWLKIINPCRVDLTEGKIYSLSPATRKYLDSMTEPLLIRGYFSKRNHPLLQSTIPRLKDLLNEYQAAAPRKVTVEFVDPQTNAKIEKEALETYGIRPAPFTFASKYQSSVVNAYFDVVIKYGDQYQKLNWQDLVEISTQGKEIRLDLRNPEYDITSKIKKLLTGYQTTGDLFSNIDQPINFTADISADDRLPAQLFHVKQALKAVLENLQKQSKGKLTIVFEDPGLPTSPRARKLAADYGYCPMSTSSDITAPFFFHMSLSSGERVVQIPLPNPATSEALKHSLEVGLKKFGKGFSKTIGIYQVSGPQSAFNYPPVNPYSLLAKRLQDEYLIEKVNLESGSVPVNVDLMLVLAPENMGNRQIYALDQFLMRGGTVVIATSPFDVDIDNRLLCRKAAPETLDWLRNYGLEVQPSMVLDTQNFPFTTTAKRLVNKTEVIERRLAAYPYSVAITKNGLERSSEITAGIKQLLFSWCSPIVVKHALNQNRKITELLHSSPNSWTSENLNLEPQYSPDTPLGFKPGSLRGKQLLAVALEGRFDSYFKGKAVENMRTESENNTDALDTFLDRSPDSSRIIVFASSTFVTDKMIYLLSSIFGKLSLEPLDLVQNSIDWSLDDRDLLSIRGRGNFVRALYPPTPGVEQLFEYMNYGCIILEMILLFVSAKVLILMKTRQTNKLLVSKSYQQPEIQP